MPLDQIHAVLEASDLSARNEFISAHLASLEQDLARTQSAVASLRNLFARPSAVGPVSHRRVGATTAAAVCAVIAMSDLLPWYLGALGELYATLEARGMRASGPAGGIYAGELFTDERGQATVFIPTATEVQRLGRVEPVVVPGNDGHLAVPGHVGYLVGHGERDVGGAIRQDDGILGRLGGTVIGFVRLAMARGPGPAARAQCPGRGTSARVSARALTDAPAGRGRRASGSS
jgi:hypothetical protein